MKVSKICKLVIKLRPILRPQAELPNDQWIKELSKKKTGTKSSCLQIEGQNGGMDQYQNQCWFQSDVPCLLIIIMDMKIITTMKRNLSRFLKTQLGANKERGNLSKLSHEIPKTTKERMMLISRKEVASEGANKTLYIQDQ